MQKAIRAILAVSSRVLLIGLTIQIGIGIIWMVMNFGSLQAFEKTSFSALIGEGVLLLLWQVIQVLVAFFAVFRLLRTVKVMHISWTIWGSLAAITVPMAMQCHMAVLPYSLASSMILLELGSVLKYLRSGETLTAHALLEIVIPWVVSAVLMPEYLGFGAISVVLVFARSIGQLHKVDKGQIARNGLLILACWGVIFDMHQFTILQEEAQTSPSMAEAMVSRTAWTTLQQDYFDLWTEEMRAVVDVQTLQESAHYAYCMQDIFVPAVKNALGEDADAFLWEVSRRAWEGHTSEIAHQIIWDCAGYMASPTVHHMMLQRRGYDSYSGQNYDVMVQNAPMISKSYVDYSGWWFAIGMAIAAMMQVFAILQQGIKNWFKQNGLWTLICILTCSVMVLWYAFQGSGMFDYKNTIAIAMLWTAWMAVHGSRNIEG